MPADPHDTETIHAPPLLRIAVPGTSMALRQVPFTWLTTNAWPLQELSTYCPPALQLPADAHDTEMTDASPCTLRAAVPGTSMAVRQVPFTWLSTNTWVCPEPSV